MSKGNNKKGNREAKKPKKISAKVPATAAFSSKPAQAEINSRKQK